MNRYEELSRLFKELFDAIAKVEEIFIRDVHPILEQYNNAALRANNSNHWPQYWPSNHFLELIEVRLGGEGGKEEKVIE